MTLQERQKREIEALGREIDEEDGNPDYRRWFELQQALSAVINDPETYFKNIDDETNNS